jgi:hypothetical protein
VDGVWQTDSVPGVNPLIAVPLIGGAAYRLWRLIAVDVISRRARGWLFGVKVEVTDSAELGGALEPEDEEETRWPKLFHMWHCPWCMGTWLAFGLTLVANRRVKRGIAAPVLVGLAAAAVTGLLGANDPDQMYSS